MRTVQINSIIAANETIVTLFYDECRNIVYYTVSKTNIPCYDFCRRLNIDVSEEQEEEILSHSTKIWGNTQDIYLLKYFIPLSTSLWLFIEDCWDAIKRQEPELFPKK